MWRAGKTTIARILARIYRKLGVLKRGHLVEVERSKLVAGYVGQTAIQTKDPGPNWRDDFVRYPTLWTVMERVLCPRVHFKCIIVDGVKAYFGSANLSGAGMGAKSVRKRNFENGILTDDPALVEPLAEQFDSVWRGAFCRDCGRREHCSDPVL